MKERQVAARSLEVGETLLMRLNGTGCAEAGLLDVSEVGRIAC